MAQEQQKESNLLDKFTLDDDLTFFDIKETDDTTEPLPEKKEGKKKEEEKKEKAEDYEFFSQAPDEEGGTEGETEELKEDKNKGSENNEGDSDSDEADSIQFFTDLASDLKEKGLLSLVDLPKEGQITEDTFFDLYEQEINARVNEVMDGMVDEIGETGVKFLRFLKNGGDPTAFIEGEASKFSLQTLDTSNEEQVDKTIKYYLSNFENLDKEDIQDKFSWLEDSGKKESYAKKYFKIIKDTERKAEEERQAILEEAVRNKEEKVKEFNRSISTTISGMEDINGEELSQKEKKSLEQFILKPTVKVDGGMIPELQHKLAKILTGKTEEDKKQFIILAKFINDGLTISEKEKQGIRTKIVAKTKSALYKNRDKRKNENGKSLADLFT